MNKEVVNVLHLFRNHETILKFYLKFMFLFIFIYLQFSAIISSTLPHS